MNDFSFLRRRNSQLLVACLFAILGMTLALREASAQTNGWHLKTTYSRLPATVDLPNPGRGYIRSGFLSSYANPHFTSTETYTRFSWADIEKAEGTYNFAVIDQMLGKLAAGQRLSFRIYGVNPCFSAHQRTLSLHGASVAVDFDIPEYLMQEKAWYAPNYYVISGTSPCSNGSTYVALPDWNSDRFLNSVTRLFAALGAKYDKDPRIGSIDFGVFGDWGEWHSEPVSKDKEHTWGKYPYCDSTYNAGGALLVTELSMKKIIDLVAAGFQNKQLILNIGADYAVVAYALKLQAKTPVGLRSDSWTNSWFITGMLSSGRYVMPGGGPTPGGACARTSIPLSAAERAVVMDNWQKAPFIAESFASYGSFVDSDFVAQILNCKVTQIHNGSWGKPYQTLSKEISGRVGYGWNINRLQAWPRVGIAGRGHRFDRGDDDLGQYGNFAPLRFMARKACDLRRRRQSRRG